VDSGNLAACLLTLRQGCLAIPRESVLRWECWQGLLDTVAVFREMIDSLDSSASETVLPIQDHLDHVRQQILTVQERPDRWAALLAKLHEEDLQELDRLLMALIEASRRTINAATVESLRIWTKRIRHHLLDVRRELETVTARIGNSDAMAGAFGPVAGAPAWGGNESGDCRSLAAIGVQAVGHTASERSSASLRGNQATPGAATGTIGRG
jgi:hypothetical protein